MTAIHANDIDELVAKALGPEHFGPDDMSDEATNETFKIRLPVIQAAFRDDGCAQLELGADGILTLAKELKRLASARTDATA